MQDYKNFVKSYFEKYRGKMQPVDIIKLAAKDWKKVGKSKTKGGSLDNSDSSDSETGAGMSAGSLKTRKVSKKVSKASKVRGGNWLSDTWDSAVDGVSQGFNLVTGAASSVLPFLPLLA